MSSNEVQIILENYNGICHPGQTISGRVDCNFYAEKKIRAIRIKFKGKCNTHWTESEKYYDDFFKEDRYRDVDYKGEESYFYEEYNLYGGGAEIQMSAGNHSFAFSYILPQNLPSSYQSEYGKIEYIVKAVVDCPWQFDSEAQLVLHLVSPLDLNFSPRIKEPVEISVDKVMCSCWCSGSDALTFTFSLPVTGYVPGQNVQVGCYVQNMTNVSAERVAFKIKQLIETIANQPSHSVRHIENTVVVAAEGGIGAHGEKSWTTLLNIPTNMLYPNTIPSRLINISYELKAEVVVPCPHTNLTAKVPLYIGDIPLRITSTNTPSSEPQSLYPNASAPHDDFSFIDAPVQNVMDLPAYGFVDPSSGGAPPSYDEAQNFKMKEEKS